MSKIEVKEPVIIKNVFTVEEHKELKNIMKNWKLGSKWDSGL